MHVENAKTIPILDLASQKMKVSPTLPSHFVAEVNSDVANRGTQLARNQHGFRDGYSTIT